MLPLVQNRKSSQMICNHRLLFTSIISMMNADQQINYLSAQKKYPKYSLLLEIATCMCSSSHEAESRGRVPSVNYQPMYAEPVTYNYRSKLIYICTISPDEAEYADILPIKRVSATSYRCLLRSSRHSCRVNCVDE